jgi:hypothetical protein
VRKTLFFFLPREWQEARAEFAVRRRQEHYRRARANRTHRLDPDREHALRLNDLEVKANNRKRAVELANRRTARAHAKLNLALLRFERAVMRHTPRTLQPLVAWYFRKFRAREVLRDCITTATQPIRPKRHFQQARNFTPPQ